ncbi:MAG: hypothetical protein ACE5IL_17875 [Myxococcota bacterium]
MIRVQEQAQQGRVGFALLTKVADRHERRVVRQPTARALQRQRTGFLAWRLQP